MNTLELTVVGGLMLAGAGLVATAAVRAWRRTRIDAASDRPASPRRAPPDFEEDPIVAAIGIGDGQGNEARR